MSASPHPHVAGARLARRTRPRGRPVIALLVLAAAAAGASGCLWEPRVEDRWTRLDLESASLLPLQPIAAGSAVSINGRVNVTYRTILTGVVVAELRASSSIPSAGAPVHPDAERVPMAAAIDQILANSVTLGRDTRLVTGWDHLIQPFDFAFSASVPTALDSTGAPIGLFLLCYLGSGTEVELPGGADSLIVTPFGSSQYQILPVGMSFPVMTAPIP